MDACVLAVGTIQESRGDVISATNRRRKEVENIQIIWSRIFIFW